jgi:prepilin-type N-terminal cleavage/methylation domain-containing protein
MPKTNHSSSSGVTLIELIVVLTFISIFAGVTYTILNIPAQRSRASDSVKRSNLQRIVEALRLQRTAEGSYPTDTNGDGTPENISGYFAQGWLNDQPVGAVYRYWVNAGLDTIGVTVAVSTNQVLKYHSAWAQIRVCGPSAIPSDTLCP